MPTQQGLYAQQNANDNLNGCSSNEAGRLMSGMPPAIVQNGTAGNIKIIGNESKISYEVEAKQILPHSPILNGINGNITNSSNQLQQQSVLHNKPSLQANVIRHALPVPPPPLAYEIIGSIKRATNRISERQQQQTAPQGKGLLLHIHDFMKYRASKEIYRLKMTNYDNTATILLQETHNALFNPLSKHKRVDVDDVVDEDVNGLTMSARSIIFLHFQLSANLGQILLFNEICTDGCDSTNFKIWEAISDIGVCRRCATNHYLNVFNTGENDPDPNSQL
ncbi:hypothetical protein GQX74_005930 [Glossina fuscipes]|nr:hypothetical protein GQX74_005930 [Glossina fuscipes]